MGVLVGVQGTAAYQSAYDTGCKYCDTQEIFHQKLERTFRIRPTIVPDKDIDISQENMGVKQSFVDRTQTGMSVDCYVRVAVGIFKQRYWKSCYYEKYRIATNWIYGDDGFYYYKNVSSGKASQPTQLVHRIS